VKWRYDHPFHFVAMKVAEVPFIHSLWSVHVHILMREKITRREMLNIIHSSLLLRRWVEVPEWLYADKNLNHINFDWFDTFSQHARQRLLIFFFFFFFFFNISGSTMSIPQGFSYKTINQLKAFFLLVLRIVKL